MRGGGGGEGGRGGGGAGVFLEDLSLADRVSDKGLVQRGAFISGAFAAASDGKEFSVYDPGSRAELAKVADLGAEDVRRAVADADLAWGSWRKLLAKERGQALQKWGAEIRANAEDLAIIASSESGKPIAEARAEVSYAVSFIDLYAAEATRVRGTIIPPTSPNRRLFVQKQPVGPCALVTPWNFPLAMITRKAAPALAAGCTCVIKPSELTPFSALALAELARRAGVPPGVLNVVPVSREGVVAAGDVLTGDTRIRKLSFTGSTAIGTLLAAKSAATVKRTSLELGGNAPFIVMPDADMDAAIKGAMLAKFRNSGQTCVAANRFLVHESVYEDFVARLTSEAETLALGHGLDSRTTIGPLINEAACRKAAAFVDDAIVRGARVTTGGDWAQGPFWGNFFPPTVIRDATDEMACTCFESFAPLAPVIKFSTAAEAVALANDTPAGLACYLYSQDLALAWRMAEELEYGMVGINEALISHAEIPFGGIKESGVGREGSELGIEEYLEVRHICMGLGDAPVL